MNPAEGAVVWLVDDDPGVRKSLARVLQADGFVVEVFDSAEAFLAHPAGGAPGCLVLDVTMPGLDGLSLQARLAEAGGAMPIVFLTGHGDIPMSVKAMKAGASDFLTKPVAAKVLVAAVRSALERDAARRRATAASGELRRRFGLLTEREREVLEALARGKLNKQIAADLGIVEQTVKFHRANVMERMQARTIAELMHMAATLGVAADAPASDAADGQTPRDGAGGSRRGET